jgi:hypothetical protein
MKSGFVLITDWDPRRKEGHQANPGAGNQSKGRAGVDVASLVG